MTAGMENTNRSPRITYVSWGKLEVEGKAEPYKDAKLFPGEFTPQALDDIPIDLYDVQVTD